jgi:hypothetical protein
MSELHRSAKGKLVDMNKLMNQNELTVAVSNVRINARGDELGPGGQIIRKQSSSTDIPSTGIPSQQHIARPTQTQVSSTSAIYQPAPIAAAEKAPNGLVEMVQESVAEITIPEKSNKGKP